MCASISLLRAENRTMSECEHKALADGAVSWPARGAAIERAGFLLAVMCGLAATSGADVMLADPIVLTQVPRAPHANARRQSAESQGQADWFDGARLVVVSPQGGQRVLAQELDSACDPDVSFDGQRVLFAGRKNRAGRWRVWEIGVDGQGLRPVSPEHLDARAPIYVSTLFTLDSPEPWFTTVFLGREAALNERGRGSASSLFNVKLDGTELRRLTFNPNPNFDPFQMWDGRVVYAAEHQPQEPGAGVRRVGLYGIHIEGADRELYGGAQGRRFQRMPCATERGLVLFVESDQPTWDGAGQLACVEERRPHATYRALTTDAGHAFLYPSPLQGNQVLVSRRSASGEGTAGLFRFDADTGQCEPVFDSPDFHEVQAVVVRPRPRPDGHSTVVTTTNDFGTFYGLNCYTANPMREAHLKPGEVKRVRFIEGVLQTASDGSDSTSADRGPWLPRRLVGEAPVEADGSFNVQVPADTPLLLQTLDARGLALGTCGWIWVKPKETRGCIGCHEDPELIPENEYVLALRRPSNRLLLPPAQRRSVAFRQDIAPLLQKHCAAAECHGGNDTPFRLPLTAVQPTEQQMQAAYQALVTPREASAEAPWPRPGRYVDAGRARTSWLVWQLLGTNTSRPWDPGGTPAEAPARQVKLMPPPDKGRPLRPEDVRTLIQWIDLGAQYEAVKTR
jgi:hypothetical protein